MNGVYDTSVAITGLPLYAHENGASLEVIAAGFLLVIGFFWMRTFLLLPVKNVPNEAQMEKFALKDSTAVGKCLSSSKSGESSDEYEKVPEKESSDTESESMAQYVKTLFTLDYLIYLYAYVILDRVRNHSLELFKLTNHHTNSRITLQILAL